MSDSKAASKIAMEALHSLLAMTMAEQLKNFRAKKEEPPASLLNVIRQFLKDNSIEADREKTVDNPDPLGILKKEFEFEDDESDDPQLTGSMFGG